MNIHPLLVIVSSWVLGGFVYLLFAVSRLQSKFQDLSDELDELKKEIKNDNGRSN